MQTVDLDARDSGFYIKGVAMKDEDNFLVFLDSGTETKLLCVVDGTELTRTLSTSTLGTFKYSQSDTEFFYLYYYQSGIRIYKGDVTQMEGDDEVELYSVTSLSAFDVNSSIAFDGYSFAGVSTSDFPRLYLYRVNTDWIY